MKLLSRHAIPRTLTDIAGGFGIERSNATVIEGDNVTLSCGGSRLDFDGAASLEWGWSQSDTGPLQNATDLTGEGYADLHLFWHQLQRLIVDEGRM